MPGLSICIPMFKVRFTLVSFGEKASESPDDSANVSSDYPLSQRRKIFRPCGSYRNAIRLSFVPLRQNNEIISIVLFITMSAQTPFLVFSGTHSRYLAEKICNSLQCPLAR